MNKIKCCKYGPRVPFNVSLGHHIIAQTVISSTWMDLTIMLMVTVVF